MIAFALSGGGNRGPIQVGAMRALFERGIVPRNFGRHERGRVERRVHREQSDRRRQMRVLVQMWLDTKSQDIFPKPRLSMILRALFSATGWTTIKRARKIS